MPWGPFFDGFSTNCRNDVEEKCKLNVMEKEVDPKGSVNCVKKRAFWGSHKSAFLGPFRGTLPDALGFEI